MAIIWEQNVEGICYQVRSAGRTRRLYTNGVFHSQYHPERAISGGVWDLLMLPVHFHALDEPLRILVLGVGGGAVIHLIKRYFPHADITGVELNPVHLEVAREQFGITPGHAQLVCADAVQWLQDQRGAHYDVIIEDLFGEEGGEPVRAVPAGHKWLRQLRSRLAPDGTLVMNFVDVPSFREAVNQGLTRGYRSAFGLSLPLFENRVAVLTRKKTSSAQLRGAVHACPPLAAACRKGELSYHVRRIGER